MALGIPAAIRSHLRPRLGRRNKSTGQCCPTIKDPDATVDGGNSSSARERCHLLRDLPAEIRTLIYDRLWEDRGPGFHIYKRDGRLYHARCVMDPKDEDPDFIQKQMDWVHSERRLGTFGESKLCMWQKRLSDYSWGHRHWRCEERLGLGLGKYFGPTAFDRTDWLNMMLVCRQM